MLSILSLHILGNTLHLDITGYHFPEVGFRQLNLILEI